MGLQSGDSAGVFHQFIPFSWKNCDATLDVCLGSSSPRSHGRFACASYAAVQASERTYVHMTFAIANTTTASS